MFSHGPRRAQTNTSFEGAGHIHISFQLVLSNSSPLLQLRRPPSLSLLTDVTLLSMGLERTPISATMLSPMYCHRVHDWRTSLDQAHRARHNNLCHAGCASRLFVTRLPGHGCVHLAAASAFEDICSHSASSSRDFRFCGTSVKYNAAVRFSTSSASVLRTIASLTWVIFEHLSD